MVCNTNVSEHKLNTMASIEADLSGTKYNVVYKAIKESGFFPNTEQNSNTFLIWNDAFISAERVAELKSYQKINHFPGMSEISRKDTLARNMAKLAKAIPEEYDFVPRTWILPADMSSLISYYRELKAAKKTKYFIVKPANGAQGHGIWLTKNLDKIIPNGSNSERQYDGFVIQEYIDKPFLVEGFKCDLRIYALITCCDPLRIFLYSDGLVRFATEVYRAPAEDNCNKLFMHLTNYSVNKKNASFERGDSSGFRGSKRSLRFLTSYLRKNDIDVAHLWRRISDLVVKTILAVEPHILLSYRSCRPGQSVVGESVCFELLGFDVLLDEHLKPWLLEVNRSPSFATDTDLDKALKKNLLKHTLDILNIRSTDRMTVATIDKTNSQRRLLRPSRRSENDIATIISRTSQVEDLEATLFRIRADGAREDYENRHCGAYRRVFPPADIFSRERFGKLLITCVSSLLPTRSASLLKELQTTYLQAPKEEDIMDKLSEFNVVSNSDDESQNPEQAQMYNLLQQKFSEPEENSVENEENDLPAREQTKRSAPSAKKGSTTPSRPHPPPSRSESMTAVRPADGPPPPLRLQKTSRTQTALHTSVSAPNFRNPENDEQLVKACLDCLKALRIRFPGKSEEETDGVLLAVAENWPEYRAPIATYWLVRLDHVRRRRLLDIVKSNVWAVIQQIWSVDQAENTTMGRTIQRLFNRLLWNNGQGLWNTFSVFNRSNWETIFSYSTYPISPVELNCCRRVVQLCRDCLLVVYKFAEEARQNNNSINAVTATNNRGQTNSMPNSSRGRSSSRVSSSVERPIKISLTPNHPSTAITVASK